MILLLDAQIRVSGKDGEMLVGTLNPLGSLQHVNNEIFEIHRVDNEVPYSENNVLTNYSFKCSPAYLI